MIAIKDTDMAKSCDKCIFKAFAFFGSSYCYFDEGCALPLSYDKRPDWCPLVDVKEMENEQNKSIKQISGYTRIIVESDEENPEKIAEITADNVDVADGYRVRLRPDYGDKKCD